MQMKNMDMTVMACPLPKHIALLKANGDYTGCGAAIEAMLSGASGRHVSAMLRDRLTLELTMLERLPLSYTLTQADALVEARRHIPDFSGEEFAARDAAGEFDFAYVDGEKRYFTRFFKSLVKADAALAARAGVPFHAQAPYLDEAIAALKARGELAYRFVVDASLQVADAAYTAGETYRLYIPVPLPGVQVSEVAIAVTGGDGVINDAHVPARCAVFTQELAPAARVSVQYSYVNRIRYVDFHTKPAAHIYDAPPVKEEDLTELLPHVRFTPYLRSLAAEIVAGEADPVTQARKIYDYITTQVTYNFVPQYFLLPDIAEQAALNLKGDCGIQALLFITLCRIVKIPARWQSGLCITADGVIDAHDWAQFYVEPWGWVFADCSFGGGARRNGNEERRQFYFGNIDPFRVVTTPGFMAPLTPPMQYMRADPYDNQYGEGETATRELLLSDLITDYVLVQRERME
jgi:transglutaminase-like putative cysteine protease